MKKLMFALIAGVAATAATAAPITQAGFEEGEGFTAGQNPTNNASDARFVYKSVSSSEDSSAVRAYGDVTAKSVTYDNGEFDSAGSQYLELSTDGGTLYRSINALNNGDIGEARTVTSSLYIDTLVQFTVCDSEPPIDDGAKLAIWLQASEDESTTNLMVKAKQWTVVDEDGQVKATAATSTNRVYALGEANTYTAGTWYRLTVEDLGNVFTVAGRGATGFKILIDGAPVSAASAAFVTTDDEDATSVLAGKVTDVDGLTNGSIFMSMHDSDILNASYTTSLQAVGFSGTGLVDNIFFTEDDPFFVAPTAVDFTLTLAANTSATYSFTSNAVKYSGSVPANGVLPDKVPVGTTIEFAITTTPDALGWHTYTASLSSAVNAEIVPATTSVTVSNDFTQAMGRTASAVVSVSDSLANITDVAAAKTALGINNPNWASSIDTAEKLQALASWAAAEGRRYSTSRVNDYDYVLDRMNASPDPLSIEMVVSVATNSNVISYDSSVVGEVYNDEETGNPAGVAYTVDAGTTLVLSNFVLAAGYKLDAVAENWNTNGLTVVVDQANGVVTFTTDITAADAAAGIALAALATVDVSVTGGANATAAWTVNGESVEAPATLTEGDTYSVTFTANSGYEFVGEVTTTFEGAVGTEDIAIVAPNATASLATVNVTVTGAANATTNWMVNGEAAEAPATLTENDTYSVTFTAISGYAFDGGATTTNFSGTVAKADIVIAAPDAAYVPVYISAITLNTNSLALTVGDTFTLVATATPAENDDSIVWESSNTDVATVANGVVTSVAAGNATITAKSGHDASVNATCSVTVSAAIKPVPAGGESAAYDTAQDAIDAAAAINASTEAKAAAIALPTGIEAGSSAANTYYGRVQAVADGNKVTIEFTSAGEAEAQTSADDAATAVAAKLGEVAASSEGGAANIATEPGFYYSILYKANLGDTWTEKLPRVLGTGSTAPIAVPKAGASGFYQLKVSPTAE